MSKNNITPRLRFNFDHPCEIKQICQKYGYDYYNDIIYKNLHAMLKAEKKNNLDRNEKLLEDKDVIETPHSIPTSLINTTCLILLYKCPRINEELNYSDHPPSQIRDLRKIGYLFRTELGKDGNLKSNYTFTKNKKQYREIIGFIPTILIIENFNKLNRDQTLILKNFFPKDFLGCMSHLKEIDHRIPPEIGRKKNIIDCKLTIDSIKDGTFDKDFQILTKNTNDYKREICKKCIAGGIIELPPCIEPFRLAYRQTCNEDLIVCGGCYWHNYLYPKYEKYFPNLLKAREDHQKIINSIKDRFK